MPLRTLLAPIKQTVDSGYGDGGAGAELNPYAIHLALICTVVATCISLLSVWLHWKNYRKPNQQRQVIRILWMVPIYGISTYISLVSLDVAFYVDTFRDIYEAFVIYAFFNLLLNKLGGERALIIMLHSRPPSENFFPGTLWSREIYVGDPYTFLFVKRGILQFIYVKPVLAILTMILKATGNYQDGEISWKSSYLYLTFFYNLSVCLSLWCLMVFFYATKKDLTDFRPFPKFLCVKAIIFFSFWQSVIIALLVSAGFIQDGEGTEHISVAIQDFLICLEMIPASIAHSYAFSYEDYYDPSVHSARMPIMVAIKDSIGFKDVYMDTLDTFLGSRFNYRSFEPSEGVPHIGSSRTSRIMAGLRYSTSTSKKHWLEPAPVSRFLSAGRGSNGEVDSFDTEPLEFGDPDPKSEEELLYESSRGLVYGDYNYPVIDFRIPLWKQVRHPISASTSSSTRSRGYGGTDVTERDGKKKGKLVQYRTATPREGCIDVIIEQGKGNYVVSPALQEPSRKPQFQQPQQQQHLQVAQPPRSTRAISPPPHARHLRSSRSTPADAAPGFSNKSTNNNNTGPSPPRLSPPDTYISSPSNFRPHMQTSFSSPESTQSRIPHEQTILQEQPDVDTTDRWPSFATEAHQNTSFDEETDALLTGNVWK